MELTEASLEDLSSAMLSRVNELEPEDYEPARDRVLVRKLRLKDKEETDTGLIVYRSREEDKRKPKAIVIAVGPGAVNKKGVRMPIDVEPGDVVVAGKFVGMPVHIDGERYDFVKASDILARIVQ